MDTFSNESIIKILNSYKNKREKEKQRYEVLKLNQDFKLKNNERSRLHYQKNKEARKQKYKDNKEYLKAKQLFYYYKTNDMIDMFKIKHFDKIDLIKDLMVE